MVTGKRLGIAAVIAAVYLVLAIVAPPAFVFLSFAALWFGIWLGVSTAIRRWRERPFLQEAQYLSDICSVDYFRRVSAAQLEDWVLSALTTRGYVLLGDPVVGRSKNQGYAWLNGRKIVVVMRLDSQLKESDVEHIYNQKNESGADKAIVFSPFGSAPSNSHPGLEILSGKEFLAWMSVLNGVRPRNIGMLPDQDCSCGSPQVEHVSCGGEPLLLCSRYPDCQKAERPGLAVFPKMRLLR